MRLYLPDMIKHLPVKNLFRLVLLLSLVVSLVICLYLFQNKTEVHHVIDTLLTFVAIFCIGLSHLGIMIFLSGKFHENAGLAKTARYFLTYLAGPLAYLALWPVFAPYSDPTWKHFDLHMVITFVVSGFVVNTMFLISFDFVILQHEKSGAELEFSRLKTTHAEAANLFLKQQIHPHFLFNALNTLKSLYRKDMNAGEIYIVHLANFLRASIEDHGSKVSRLDKEVNLLNDYLEMQKIRFGAALDFSCDIADDVLTKYSIPSFSLQPLLENAIKHNDLTTKAPLRISITCSEGRIIVRNNLRKKNIRPLSTNHGLANLSERYRLLSGDDVIISEDAESFTVSIKLLPNEYSDHRR